MILYQGTLKNILRKQLIFYKIKNKKQLKYIKPGEREWYTNIDREDNNFYTLA